MNIDNAVVHLEIRKLLANLGIRKPQINVNATSDKGDNYVGLIYFVDIIGENEFDEPQKFHIVVKCAESEEDKRHFVPVRKAYEREIYCYRKVFPLFKNFQEEMDVSHRFTSWAKCLSASLEERSEMIIFENLKPLGYRLWNRMEPMDENHLKLVMKEFGRFHALTFALREKHSSAYRSITEKFDNVLESVVPNFERTFRSAYAQCVVALKEEGHLDAIEALKKIEFDLPKSFTLGSCEDEHSVIVHGDSWCNNFMFKYRTSTSSVPTGMCFLDWQISRMASPVVDLSLFFYTSAAKENLDKLDKFLHIYHDSFSSFLLELMKCDPQKLFPFIVLQRHWSEYSTYGILLSFVLLRIMHFDPNEAPELVGDSLAESMEKPIKEEKKYNRRVVDVVLHCVQENIL